MNTNTNNTNNTNNAEIVKVDAPKVTARKELAVKTENAAAVPSITFDTLLALDVVERNAKGTYNATSAANDARKYLSGINQTIASGITDSALTVLIASVGKNTETIKKAGKRASTALALIDVNKAYQRIVNPATGTPFKNTSSLFRALYPTLADSTIWNYINVGKEIYLPAQAPNAPKYLKELAELEPGTALSVVGALKDEKARKLLPVALDNAKKEKNSKKLTQSIVKAAAKAARNPDALNKKKEDGTKGTDKKDDAAKAEMDKEAWKALIRRGMAIEGMGDERYIYIYENLTQSAKEVFKAAMKDEKSALEFVTALYESLNIK